MSLLSHRSTLEQGVDQLGLNLSPEQITHLLHYGDLILKWNKVYNLTAIRDAQEVLTHHLLDSLSVVPSLVKWSTLQPNNPPRLLDVGSGAGLPGLVIAVCCPDWTVHTIDTVQKKAMFMQQACGVLKLTNAKAIHGRIESLQADVPYDIICSRAFSSLTNFVNWSAPVLAESGCFVALKGKLETDQTVPAPWHIEQVVPVEVPFLPEQRHLFLIKR